MQDGSKIEEKGDDLYSKASKCPHRKSMGCFLDVIEKSCEATRELMNCAEGKKCEKVEIKLFLDAMDPKGKASVTTCCCSSGMAYVKCKTPDKMCRLFLDNKKPVKLEELIKKIKAYKKKANKKNAKEAVKAVKEVRGNI